jgi:hypothetical protein
MGRGVQAILLEVEALLSHSCLNYAASEDSSSSNREHFTDFRCLEKSSQWTKLLSIPSQFLTIGFSLVTESLNRDTSSTYVRQTGLKYLFYHLL